MTDPTLDAAGLAEAEAWFDDNFNGLPNTDALVSGVVRAYLASAEPAGWQTADDITGKMWSAGRLVFEDEAEAYRAAQTTAMAMALADRAPEKIFLAMMAAAPTPQGDETK